MEQIDVRDLFQELYAEMLSSLELGILQIKHNGEMEVLMCQK